MNDEIDRLAAFSSTLGKKGSVLTREMLIHSTHMAAQRRDPKCLRCYPTISRN